MVRSLYSAIELITPDVWNWFEFSCLASAWVLALALELVLVFAAEVATFAVVADIAVVGAYHTPAENIIFDNGYRIGV